VTSRSAAPELHTTVPPLLTALVPSPERVVVRLTGDADVSTSPLVTGALTEAAALGMPLIVVDVATVRFWDVSGLHVLAAFTAALAASGRQCRIVGANAATRRLVALADFTNSLQLDGPVETAGEPVEQPEPSEDAATEDDPRPRRRFWCGLRRRGDSDQRRSAATGQDVSQAVGSRRWR
jgi:anti-anti-sigma factor